ncbi:MULTISPECIES: hypothetical protein [Acetobacter]|uniref:Arabinofuranosidase n=1 Tax=Acetobacter pomorum DM001 TaxID=945681 RepID=F1YRH2_9PROT|nr:MULTISPECIES: hypothetical protein [Acetobacter]ATI11082.1 hypothetical protein CPF11_00575 [Acetobacter pomorum]AXC26577.1 hypothetical protein DS739_07090 [Acetobacter sp. JWB]EGE48657.1 Arabinofuranosidase [Acetobacter pomorum DM001]KAA8386064.1 hypothetical protein FKW31_07810 [Acetobacter sp. DmW_136]KAA8420388.1 hypothetical protein FKW54_14220 [Acetobacter pomorum]
MSIGVDQAQSNGPVNVLIAGSAPGTPGTPGVGIADVRVDDQGQLLITKTDDELITLSLDAVVQLAAMQAAANIGTNINDLEANVVAAASSAVTSQGAAAESDKSAVVAEQHAADAKTAADQAVPLLASATNAVAGVTSDAAAVKVMLTAALNGDAPLVYCGYWDAAKNSPQLDSGVGNEGDLYLVAVAGTTSVDGAAAWNVGDGIWFTNGHWQYFARASWVAVAQSLYALRSVLVGSHEISADAALPFQIRDAAGNVALQVAQDGALHVLGLGLCDGSALDADTSQPSALRLVGSDGSYVDLDAPDYEQRIAQHAPALWLDAAVGVVTDDSGVVQSWSSRVASPWQVTVKTGTPVRFATAAGYAVRFDGTSALSHALPFTPGTIIAVYRNTVSTASAQPVIMGSDSATAGTPAWSLRGYIPMGVPGAYARAQGLQVGTSASVSGFAGRLNAALGHWQILGATYDGDTIAAAVGLTHATPVARALTATPLVCGGSGGLIGASYSASGILTDFFVGDLAELLVWDRVLTGREYDDVVRALQSKHSLQPVFGRFLYSAFQTTQAGNEAGGIEGLVMLSSDDGVAWQHVPTEMLFDAEHTMRDASITYHGGRFVLACTASSFAAGYQDRFSVWQSTDGRHWDFVTDVQCALNGVSAHQTWAPEWYHDPADGQLRLVVHCIIGTGGSQVYEMHPLDDLLISWSVPQLITLAGYPQVIDSFPLCIKGQWVLFFKDEAARQIQIATATSPTGPYTVQTSGNWAGWGSGVEGPSALYLGDDADGNTMLRVYLDAQGNGISYSDAVGKWPDVLTGAWSPPKLLSVASRPQHGTCIRNPFPHYGA